jgi:hypothetical protein
VIVFYESFFPPTIHFCLTPFQEYKHQLLRQISDRVQAKQQQQQQDNILIQKSLYGAAAKEPHHKILRDQGPQEPVAQGLSHPLPLGVRSFLDTGSREPGKPECFVPFLLSITAVAGSTKASRLEYAAQLTKQIQTRQALKAQRS